MIFVAKKKRMKFLCNDLQSSFPWFASVRRIRVNPRSPWLKTKNIDPTFDSGLDGHMPITAFSNFTDGLDPNRRSREHFITNINLEDDRLWVPYANGVWFQPCCFNVTSGGFSVLLKGLPGSMVGTHYHVGTVHGYTMRGHWRYLEHDWIAKPGTYIYEPAGEAHTLVITEDSPEPMMTLFVVGGGLIYLDKAVNGGFAAYEDGFTLLELARKYYREAGLDARQLDLLVR